MPASQATRSGTTALAALLWVLCAAASCAPRGAVPEPALDSSGAEPAKERGEPAAVASSASLPQPLREVLEAHNRARAEHCAPPLQWSTQLASVAQAWANQLRARGCAFAHSQTNRYGENLYFAAPSSPESGARAVESWVSERGGYRFVRPGFSMQTGHFTQVVWRGTRELGCGTAQCNGGDLWVCNYAPAGNVQGQYETNVQPTTCRR